MDSNNRNAAKKNAEHDQVIVELRNELERERRNCQNLEEKCRRQDVALRELQDTFNNRLNKIENENAELESMISRLQKEVPSFKQQINQLKEDLEVERAARSNAEFRLGLLNERQREDKSTLSLSIKLDGMSRGINIVANELAKEKTLRSDAKIRIASLKQRVKDLEEQLEREESAFPEKNSARQESVPPEGGLVEHNKIEQANTQLIRREEDYRNAIIKNDKLKSTMSCLQKEIRGFKNQINNIQEDLKIERVARAEAERLCRDLQHQQPEDTQFTQYVELAKYCEELTKKHEDEEWGNRCDKSEIISLNLRIMDLEESAPRQKSLP
uniref:Uncharacterized protein n=1 Tax=Panagrellus redivivus TaxID=6233 RepID=A0A7E4UMA2_PANRE